MYQVIKELLDTDFGIKCIYKLYTCGVCLACNWHNSKVI